MGSKVEERVASAGRLDALLADLRENEVLEHVKRAISNQDPTSILEELRAGMTIVGDRFEKQEYFLSEMVMAAEIFNEAMKLIEPKLAGQKTQDIGTIVIGTVHGDIHNIGKDIVATMLRQGGFRVYDAGVDVPPEKFVEIVQETNPNILGMSTLLTQGVESMKATVQKLVYAGIRKNVKVMIGGNPVCSMPEKWLLEVGADDYGKDAMDALKKAKRLVGC